MAWQDGGLALFDQFNFSQLDNDNWDDEEEDFRPAFNMTASLPSLPSLPPTNGHFNRPSQNLSPLEDKAALLKAKLIEKRRNSPLPSSVSGPRPKPASPPINEAQVQEDSSAAIDHLLREAIDAQSDQRKSNSELAGEVEKAVATQPVATQPPQAPATFKVPTVTADKVKKKKKDKPNGLGGKAPQSELNVSPPESKMQDTASRAGKTDQTVQQKQDAASLDTLASPVKSMETLAAPTGDNDLKDWLEFTGYHDKVTREHTLQLHRRRRALETELLALNQEISQSSNFRAVATPTPTPTPAPAPQLVQTHNPSTNLIPNGSKRTHSPDTTAGAVKRSSDKFRRTISSAKNDIPVSLQTGSWSRRRSRSPLSQFLPHDTNCQDSRGRANSRRLSPPSKRHRSRSPLPFSMASSRPSYRNRHESERPGSSKVWVNPAVGGRRRPLETLNYDNGANGLELHKGNCRYFMVKSWNYDNVLQAQKDGLWCTQAQNEHLFAEAFRTCRHVIFFFSVNNSKVFQGYARMESLPGTAAAPIWSDSLKWPTSPPYKIHWITVADTRFRDVGHLKNTLNEDRAVLIGRDGQEIDEQCGASLCEAIDEEWGRQNSKGSWSY